MNIPRVITLMTLVGLLLLPNLATAAEQEASPVAQSGSVTRPPSLSVLYATFGAMQAWDVYSTAAALKAGAREGNPIASSFAGNTGAMIGLKVVSTASTIFFAERLWKKHRVAAVVVMIAINGATAAAVMHNMRNARAPVRRP